MTIETRVVYICPETGKQFSSADEAERSAAAAIAAKRKASKLLRVKKRDEKANLEKKDWIRLNLANVADIPKLIQEKAKEFWDIDCEIKIFIRFGKLGSHCSPINTNCKRGHEYLGWSGRIEASIFNFPKNQKSYESVSSLLFDEYSSKIGFRGFNIGSGCPGDVYGQYKMNMDFCFFLQDFPILCEKYDIFLSDQNLIEKYNEEIATLTSDSIKAAKSDRDYLRLQAEIQDLEKQKEAQFNTVYEGAINAGLKTKNKPDLSKDHASIASNFYGSEKIKTPNHFYNEML